ncbi:hypothetical protein CAMGR0001_0792 [Campylobacter gracilis RM3268]|uniref:Uncharacterized protein n=1 Tax=Campylobacter gracilis RM3268 TaxID=553220 RepID=C8PFZ9_9BACT|nr:hypothetical protein CAMGR0001_0792 [Campylobacter gracilis RM3268]
MHLKSGVDCASQRSIHSVRQKSSRYVRIERTQCALAE